MCVCYKAKIKQFTKLLIMQGNMQLVFFQQIGGWVYILKSGVQYKE